MNDYLVFQLRGPLAAWGDTAVGEFRPSLSDPGRSQILGLLAAALGIRRDADAAHAALAAGYRVAVWTRNPGQLLRDYHTAQVPPQVALKKMPHASRRDELLALAHYNRQQGKSVGTILSTRDYRADGDWRVVIQAVGEPPYALPDLARALRRPRFVLYLGRKSCPPALPLHPQVVSAADIHRALRAADFPILDSRPRQVVDGTLQWQEGMDSGLTQACATLQRNDQPLSRARWQFGRRTEHRAPRREEV